MGPILSPFCRLCTHRDLLLKLKSGLMWSNMSRSHCLDASFILNAHDNYLRIVIRHRVARPTGVQITRVKQSLCCREYKRHRPGTDCKTNAFSFDVNVEHCIDAVEWPHSYFRACHCPNLWHGSHWVQTKCGQVYQRPNRSLEIICHVNYNMHRWVVLDVGRLPDTRLVWCFV